MAIRTTAFVLVGLGLLSGCQTTPADLEAAGGVQKIHSIRLDQALTIPAGYATVRLQAGRTVAMNAVQEFDPYCIFELNTVRAAPQKVAPGTFEVTSVQQRIQDFAGMPVMPTAGIMSSIFGDGGPSQHFLTDAEMDQAVGRYFSFDRSR